MTPEAGPETSEVGFFLPVKLAVLTTAPRPPVILRITPSDVCSIDSRALMTDPGGQPDLCKAAV